jgi:hypothetical protein
VVLEELVWVAIASADRLEEQALGAVVEEAIVVRWGVSTSQYDYQICLRKMYFRQELLYVHKING